MGLQGGPVSCYKRSGMGHLSMAENQWVTGVPKLTGVNFTPVITAFGGAPCGVNLS